MDSLEAVHTMNNYTPPKVEKQKNLDQAETERNEKIKELYATGLYSYNKLARIYHISPQRIGQIINGDKKGASRE